MKPEIRQILEDEIVDLDSSLSDEQIDVTKELASDLLRQISGKVDIICPGSNAERLMAISTLLKCAYVITEMDSKGVN